jgi:hypothetical protein
LPNKSQDVPQWGTVRLPTSHCSNKQATSVFAKNGSGHPTTSVIESACRRIFEEKALFDSTQPNR